MARSHDGFTHTSRQFTTSLRTGTTQVVPMRGTESGKCQPCLRQHSLEEVEQWANPLLEQCHVSKPALSIPIYCKIISKIRAFNLSHNNPSFQCITAITNFLVSDTCEKRFHDVIGQSTVPMYSSAKILKHGQMSMFWTLIFSI